MIDLADTAARRLLGCRVPVVLAGMGGVARHELVAAVTEAGGFGFLGMVREPVALIESEVAALRALGHTRFGVNLIPAATPAELLEAQLAACIRLQVPVIGLFWDIDPAIVARCRDAGMIVCWQVGSVDEAIAAERAGVDIIIAQGREAGGHVRGTRRLAELLPEVVAAVGRPVLAAGGLASGGDLVVARALGADGIVLGTALMATQEAFAHPYHKQRLLEAQAGDTVLTDIFHINWPIGAPVRVIRSSVTGGLFGRGDGGPRRIIGDEEGRSIYLFSTDSPLRSMTGDFALMALYAGTGIGKIEAIPPAGARMAALMEQAQALLATPDAGNPAETSSPVCYAGEFDNAYMGSPEAGEIAATCAALASDLRQALHLALADHTEQYAFDAPPFGDEAPAYAGWLLALAPDKGNPTSQMQTLAALLGAMQARIDAIVARLPETGLRQQLSQLRQFLTLQQRRLAKPALAQPGRPEILSASDR
ncbi:MAG: hypothetical protein ABS76_27780 [Pelagibacterium sp. SCN 64-44]|nr:MAG: hypothetical protein ABS76_27780 [Pelagibacterium sp. SCN 64-44]